MVEYQILNSGFFYADGGAMFGAIPKSAWIRKYPCDEKNTCRMAMCCLLVWDKNHVVLLDTGVGSKHLGKLSYYRFNELQDISTQLHQFGFSPGDVTDVVLSHLHFDHCGGCTFLDEAGNLQPTYPNAKHWVSKAQWENYLLPNRLEKHSFRESDMLAVYESGLLHLVNDDMDLFPGFRMDLYDGHTRGQIVSSIETANGLCIFPGDVIPTLAHLSIDWLSAYDTEPLLSVESKLQLKQKIKERNAFLVFYHDAVSPPALSLGEAEALPNNASKAVSLSFSNCLTKSFICSNFISSRK